MSFAVSLVSVSPMRLEPSHRSEMVSQLLFGEFCEVLDTSGDFTKIRCLYDGYEGWCQTTQLELNTEVLEPKRYNLAYTEAAVLDTVTPIPIAFGTPVYGKEEEELLFGTRKVYYGIEESNLWDSSKEACNDEALLSIAENYIGTAYLWGGKSVFGIDCSGFVQQVYKFFNVPLLRDAYLQAGQGTEVNYKDTAFGDLAFFKNENEKITHVGLMLDNYKIMHASGRVRIDELKEDGIYSSETGKRTHAFHSIRRVL